MDLKLLSDQDEDVGKMAWKETDQHGTITKRGRDAQHRWRTDENSKLYIYIYIDTGRYIYIYIYAEVYV